MHYADTDEEMVSLDSRFLQRIVGDSFPHVVLTQSFGDVTTSSHYSTETPMGQNRRVDTSWVDVIGAASR